MLRQMLGDINISVEQDVSWCNPGQVRYCDQLLVPELIIIHSHVQLSNYVSGTTELCHMMPFRPIADVSHCNKSQNGHVASRLRLLHCDCPRIDEDCANSAQTLELSLQGLIWP